MTSRSSFVAAALAVASLTACGARSAQLPAVNLRFYETPPEAPPTERINEKFTLNAALIGNAGLRYQNPADLLKAAETSTGEGSPQKLLQAGRTIVADRGVALIATVRSQEAAGGSAKDIAQYLLALACAPADLDRPGDLQGCKGYILRVTRAWPAEVYALEQPTVSLIPEGGTARGRLRARSAPGGFRAEVDGEFAASIVQFQHGQTVAWGAR